MARYHDLVPSTTATTSGSGGVLVVSGDKATASLNVTAASGTTPTLDVSVEWSLDGVNWGLADSFTQATAAGFEMIELTVKAQYVRVSWVVAGTTPSFDFEVRAFTR